MSKQRVRPSLFPGYPPYLNFVGPGEDYEDGEKLEEDLGLEFTVARGTGPVIMDCLNKFGFKIIEVNYRPRIKSKLILISSSGHLET